MRQLQLQQLERMQLAVQFLTTPLVRSQPKRQKGPNYLKKQLRVSGAELEEHSKGHKTLFYASDGFPV